MGFDIGNDAAMIGDEPLTKPLFSRVTASDYEKLKAYCDRHTIKVSALLRELVEDFLRSVEGQ